MKNNRVVILKGEGANQHVLQGNFNLINNDVTMIEVLEPCDLRHEKPNGEWSEEHKTLELEEGVWIEARQVERNPITQRNELVWD